MLKKTIYVVDDYTPNFVECTCNCRAIVVEKQPWYRPQVRVKIAKPEPKREEVVFYVQPVRYIY